MQPSSKSDGGLNFRAGGLRKTDKRTSFHSKSAFLIRCSQEKESNQMKKVRGAASKLSSSSESKELDTGSVIVSSVIDDDLYDRLKLLAYRRDAVSGRYLSASSVIASILEEALPGLSEPENDNARELLPRDPMSSEFHRVHRVHAQVNRGLVRRLDAEALRRGCFYRDQLSRSLLIFKILGERLRDVPNEEEREILFGRKWRSPAND